MELLSKNNFFNELLDRFLAKLMHPAFPIKLSVKDKTSKYFIAFDKNLQPVSPILLLDK